MTDKMPRNRFDEYELQLPFGPPPLLPDVRKQLKEYLLCPDRLPIHDYEQAQKYWPRETNLRSLYNTNVAPLGTTLKVERDPTTGKLLQFREVPLDNIGCTAKNSMSLQRAPGPPDQAIRGSDSNFPFWPGGFPELLSKDATEDQDAEVDFVNNLLSVPPGFAKGLKFKADKRTPLKEDEEPSPLDKAPPVSKEEPAKEEAIVVNLMSLVKQEEDLLDLWQEETTKDETKCKEKPTFQNLEFEIDNEVADVIPKEDIMPVLKITGPTPAQPLRKTEWAEELDVTIPVTDFEKKIPVMAKTWDFELDIFQKKAILKLEEQQNVFVAAHTSAGKTVVAEYAIALCKKNMTKAIYTSPIKALSNQKYRDFKETFEDVGLITGDFQINQTAQCLIMTTEILQSMLYRGSDVLKDVGYVIFDEVHYINDSERGHVWEEVLILLLPDIKIVMLSATVPNTLQFADWVGKTKKKKVYVFTTPKRPVPLQHFLYTGSGGKTKDQRFLILDGDKETFLDEGYHAAVISKQSQKDKKEQKVAAISKQSRQKDHKAAFGPKQGKQHLNPKQEATMWEAFIDHLQRNDKLPVVAFTLSRNRCDQNSENLRSIDLTTTKEKSYINMFFKKCIQNLKPEDRELPQVLKQERLLKQGIGVHHSGILPILKEIVEMLFQKGLVRLLFATETFAMGVNMPARTVVFDSIVKYDGLTWRTLQPAEYIQMAGRAGRRGIDKTGTVIIMCKGDVPEKEDLKSMMLGKPKVLESKFRLSYSMILNLFRTQRFSVESMMSRSFKEFGHQNCQLKYAKDLRKVEEEIKSFPEIRNRTLQWESLSKFYELADAYIKLWEYVRSDVITHPEYVRMLTPGRALVVSFQEHINKLGVLLSVESKNEKVFKVMVLCNTPGFSFDIQLSDALNEYEKSNTESLRKWYKMLGITRRNKIFEPDGSGGHTVLCITAKDIVYVLKNTFNIEADHVYNNWNERQLPRFRHNPPGLACKFAIQQLMELSQNIALGKEKIVKVTPKDIRDKRVDILEKLEKLKLQERLLEDCKDTYNIAGFEQQFLEVFKRKQLEKKRDHLKFLQSYASMSLYPEFESKVEVLCKLNFINSDKTLEFKGKIACAMSNHELIITELVLEYIIKNRQPEEIAALLSCLVFQQRTTSEPKLTDPLEEGKKQIEVISEKIQEIEKECKVPQGETVEEYEKLNFGLMQVVYEWAQGKPFSEIMQLTDVQEGIIVRCIQQLNEVVRDVKNAAHTIGDPILKQKMQEVSDAIKRDIVFAASLYTSEENRQIRPSIEDEKLLPIGDE